MKMDREEAISELIASATVFLMFLTAIYFLVQEYRKVKTYIYDDDGFLDFYQTFSERLGDIKSLISMRKEVFETLKKKFMLSAGEELMTNLEDNKFDLENDFELLLDILSLKLSSKEKDKYLSRNVKPWIKMVFRNTDMNLSYLKENEKACVHLEKLKMQEAFDNEVKARNIGFNPHLLDLITDLFEFLYMKRLKYSPVTVRKTFEPFLKEYFKSLSIFGYIQNFEKMQESYIKSETNSKEYLAYKENIVQIREHFVGVFDEIRKVILSNTPESQKFVRSDL